MPRKNNDIIWSVIGLGLFGLFILWLSWLNRPEKIVIEVEEAPKSEEHAFIGEALLDPEKQMDREDHGLLSDSPASLATEPDPGIANSIVAPKPIFQNDPAPESHEVVLSESLQGSLANSAPLATEEFLDIQSDLNNRTIGALHALSAEASKEDKE